MLSATVISPRARGSSSASRSTDQAKRMKASCATAPKTRSFQYSVNSCHSEYSPPLTGRTLAQQCASVQKIGWKTGQAEELERKIHAWHRRIDFSRKLEVFRGTGPITAGALAEIGDAKNFRR